MFSFRAQQDMETEDVRERIQLVKEKLTQKERQRVLLGLGAERGLSRVIASADVHQFSERLPNFCWGKPTKTRHFFFIFSKTDTMCKNTVAAVTPGGQENSNVNVGLLNMSSEKMGGNLSAESVMTYIIAAICLFMCFKWAKKCWNRRQEKQRNMIRSLGQGPMVNQNQGVQMPMQQIPAPLPALPAPIIIHPNQFKLGLEGTEDRMEKYRT